VSTGSASDLVDDELGELLADPSRALVACDYDGTLAPIVHDPGRAVPLPGSVEALAALAPLVGRVAVVTGRVASEAVALGGLERVPGVVVLGLYGAQRWEAGELTAPPPPPGLAAARADVDRMLDGAGLAGVRVEDKGASLAVHTRRAADPAGALAALAGPLAAVAAAHRLQLDHGRMVVELRPRGTDKGTAVRELVGRWTSFVLYVGDDLGDLPAFAEVTALRREGLGGRTVAAASPEAPEVPAAADLVVDGPPGVRELLEALVAALGSGP